MTPTAAGLGWWKRLITADPSDHIMALFTFVIAAAGILQLCVFAAQLDEMRIDQRAWLSVKCDLKQPQVNGTIMAPAVLLNTGKTPAKDVNGVIFIQRVPRNNLVDFSNPVFNGSPRGNSLDRWPASVNLNLGVLFPNEPIPFSEAIMRKQDSFGGPFVSVIWTETMQQQYSNGDFYLNVRARFTYDDAAGNPHWTQLCRIATAAGQEDIVPNATNEECMRGTSVDRNK
ncbi:MAG: hypothetical protein JWN74_3623 [Acidobacteriaceae bacterium]|nr:hypothetical protein [Acidobacteriaceae bacterium]